MQYARRLAIVIGCIVSITGATLWAFTAVAYAHHAILSGTATCSDGNPSEHVILWSIGNSQPHLAMTIDSASAVYNGSNYSVDGYTSPVPPSGATSATTTLDGSLTGTVTIVVSGSWPDGYHATNSADVALGDPCTPTTTTSPTTTTPTTAPPTTTPPTTAPPTTTPPTTGPGTTAPPTSASPTTITPPPSGTPPTPPPTTPSGCNPATSVTHCKPLAFTGAHTAGELLTVFGLLIIGFGLVLTRRRGTFAER